MLRVSSEAEISNDEEDDPGSSSYDDSFIDDRINPTSASTQAESGRVDMMAVYRFLTLSVCLPLICNYFRSLNIGCFHCSVWRIH